MYMLLTGVGVFLIMPVVQGVLVVGVHDMMHIAVLVNMQVSLPYMMIEIRVV